MGQGRHQRLALGRPGRDRRAPDVEPPALEVDVVQLVPVDEAPGGRVADLGVVLPAVPQPPEHLDEVGGLVEQLGDRAGAVARPARRHRGGRRCCAGRTVGLEGGGRHPDLDAGPAAAHVVECGDGLGDVEGLGVGGGGHRDEPDPGGGRCDPGAPMSTASRRPRTWSAARRVPLGGADWRARESSMVTKSTRPRSASPTRPPSSRGVNSSPGRRPRPRQAAGCQPAPSRATARWNASLPGTMVSPPLRSPVVGSPRPANQSFTLESPWV